MDTTCIAMLDQMARGSFYWGIGTGVSSDLELYGIEYSHMDEVRDRAGRPWR